MHCWWMDECPTKTILHCLTLFKRVKKRSVYIGYWHKIDRWWWWWWRRIGNLQYWRWMDKCSWTLCQIIRNVIQFQPNAFSINVINTITNRHPHRQNNHVGIFNEKLSLSASSQEYSNQYQSISQNVKTWQFLPSVQSRWGGDSIH